MDKDYVKELKRSWKKAERDYDRTKENGTEKQINFCKTKAKKAKMKYLRGYATYKKENPNVEKNDILIWSGISLAISAIAITTAIIYTMKSSQPESIKSSESSLDSV